MQTPNNLQRSRELRAAPNILRAMPTHFADLLPALVGIAVAVLVASLSHDYEPIYIWSGVNTRHLIPVLSVLAAYLFYDASKNSYFAQSYNLAEMDSLERKIFCQGIDPFDYYSSDPKNEDEESWAQFINVHMEKAHSYSRRAIWRLEIGTLLLFLSIVVLLFSYSLFLGILVSVLTALHAFKTTAVLFSSLNDK